MIRIALVLAAVIALWEVGAAIYYASLKPEDPLDELESAYLASVEIRTRPSTAMLETFAEERASCLYHNVSIMDLKNCNKGYLTDVVTFAKETIASPPDKASFVTCAMRCPGVHALCMGASAQHDATAGTACATVEAGCLELCLDEHWRGGSMLSYSPMWKDE